MCVHVCVHKYAGVIVAILGVLYYSDFKQTFSNAVLLPMYFIDDHRFIYRSNDNSKRFYEQHTLYTFKVCTACHKLAYA